MANTTQRGKWVKGQSGNPFGRPKLPEEFRTRIRDYTEQAVDVLVSALGDDDPKARVAAAKEILDRGWGRPGQTIDATLTKVDPGQAHLDALQELAAKRRSVAVIPSPDA